MYEAVEGEKDEGEERKVKGGGGVGKRISTPTQASLCLYFPASDHSCQGPNPQTKFLVFLIGLPAGRNSFISRAH